MRSRISSRRASTVAGMMLLLAPAGCQTVPTDSFCSIYVPVIAEKGDSNITALPAVKRRILVNELTFRSACPS